MSVFKFSPSMKKEKFEMKNQILLLWFSYKKKNVVLDPFQTTPSEGRAMTFQ